MIVGVDFDNTIVSYDELFYRAALERDLIHEAMSPSKLQIRNYLRSVGNEEAWTELQGVVYGSRIMEAVPFPGVEDAFKKITSSGHRVIIISHRSQFPYAGPKVDLHQAAREWLEASSLRKFLGPVDSAFHLMLTKNEKIFKIAEQNCDFFVDDLIEILSAPGFPQDCQRILFDPKLESSAVPGTTKASSWNEIGVEIVGRP